VPTGDDELLRALHASGLSLYEARIYLGLLRHGAQNGNELSRSARVPSSKVYAVLDKLADEGIVHAIRRDGGTRFSAIAPHELVARLRRRFNDPLDVLEEGLPQVAAPPGPNEVLAMGSREAVLASCRTLVDGASEEVSVSLWAPELDELVQPLREAHARGIQVYGMLYGAGGEVGLPGSWLAHSYADIVRSRIHGRMLTLVVDRQEAIVAHLPSAGPGVGVRTRSAALVLVVQEYLHHDRVLQSAQQKIGFAEWDRWWQADADLRTIILGESMEAPAPGVDTLPPE
jgi:sugar-specific transcriptional regulator TrmB